MRALNILLALLVSLLLAAAVFEVGLRFVGLGPTPPLAQFDAQLGWVKVPDLKVHRSTREFDVTFEMNALGLRDDPMPGPQKPAGTLRVLMLGDSFVQGYTVSRDDLFVDILERWWKSEGRAVDVVNAGTEGYSTDQEALWLAGPGRAFQPDLVLLFPYENDLFWNGELSYERFQKPRMNEDGRPELRVLSDPGEKPLWQRTALGNLYDLLTRPRRTWMPDATHRLPMEDAAFFHAGPEFMVEALKRTRGSLLSVKETCAALQARLLVVPIPHKASIQPEANKALAEYLGADPARWSADQPVETFLALCQELGIESLDVRPELHGELYFKRDWHFNPAGNHAFARVLHEELDRRGAFPAAYAARTPASEPPLAPASDRWPKWPLVFAGLWLALGTLYRLNYRDESAARAYLQVGGMLALVFAIALGGSRLLALLPPRVSLFASVLLVGGILIFILWKLGARIATTIELFASFTRRGHWYLLPLVVVLLSIGSLLVVAASSPLVAPFIYTLF